MKCLRCGWRSDPEQPDGRRQLAEHAETAGHPVCTACRRSLKWEEPTVCEPCLTDSRSLLAGIAVMWMELPRHLGQLRGGGYDQVRVGGDAPLVGGDALVLAGPGSGGTGARVLTSDELDRGLIQGIDGREHHQDNRDVNALSVAGVLTEIEDDWRHTRGEPAAVAHTLTASVRGAIGYLEVHARWAADQHPDFGEYLRALRQLHGRLERATGRDDRPVKAEASCFECSGQLLRLRKDGDPCRHDSPPGWTVQFRWDSDRGREVLFRSADEVRAEHDLAVDLWEKEHRVCLQGGFLDKWVCSRCKTEYEWARYLQAVGDQLRETAKGWSLPEHVAHALEVPRETVRTWAKRGVVATACLLEIDQDGRPVHDKKRKRMRGDRLLRVSYDEVAERVRRMMEERRRRDERAAERARHAAS